MFILHIIHLLLGALCVCFFCLFIRMPLPMCQPKYKHFMEFSFEIVFFSLPTTNLCTGDTEKYIYIYNGNIYEERKEKKSSEWNFWLILMVNDRQPTKQTFTQKYSRRFFDAEHFSNDRELIFFPSHFFRSSRMVNNK